MKRRSFVALIGALFAPFQAVRGSDDVLLDPEIENLITAIHRRADALGCEALVVLQKGPDNRLCSLTGGDFLRLPSQDSGWSVSPHHDRWFKPHNQEIAEHLGYKMPPEGPIIRSLKTQ